MKDLKNLVRPNILSIARQSAAVVTAVGRHDVRLDMCESPFNSPLNRYPAVADTERLKAALAHDKKVKQEQVTLSMGDSGALDLLLRTFCIPQRDNIVVTAPSPHSYGDLAAVNDIEIRRVNLSDAFDISADALLRATNQRSKAVFLCSPNYPTGNLLNRQEILQLADRFDGLIIVDESHAAFSRTASMATEMANHPNLVVIGNFSTDFACASLCLSFVVATTEITRYLHAAQTAHTIPTEVLNAATEILTRRRFDVDKWVKWILDERTKVMSAVKVLPFCERLYPSDANFFLMRVKNAAALKAYLAENNIDVADCIGYAGCEECLNFTIGLTHENNALLGALRKY